MLSKRYELPDARRLYRMMQTMAGGEPAIEEKVQQPADLRRPDRGGFVPSEADLSHIVRAEPG